MDQRLREWTEAAERRLARHEAAFREVNERIEDTAERFWIGGDLTQAFFCECANAACVTKVCMTLEEYEAIRAEPTRFLVAPGHETAQIENVVRETPQFRVVEKFGVAAEIALERDPRARETA